MQSETLELIDKAVNGDKTALPMVVMSIVLGTLFGAAGHFVL